MINPRFEGAWPTYSAEIGSYADILSRMLDRAHEITYVRDGIPVCPLRHLNTGAKHDFGVALLGAWAVVADVLSFYQERIAQEGYLQSAVEAESLRLLAREVGYRLFPGVSASAYVALQVAGSRNGPTSVLIPAGSQTAIQSMPTQGEMPVIFEAAEAIEARLEWNQLSPFVAFQPAPQILSDGALEMRLAGVVTSIRAGSPILLIANTGHTPAKKVSHFRLLDSVKINRPGGYTLITWKNPLSLLEDDSPQQVTAVFTFRQKAGLFGARAAGWNSLSDTARARFGESAGGVWTASSPTAPLQSITRNLPQQDVRALMIGQNGLLYAATGAGLYRLQTTDAEAQWEVLPTLPTRQDGQSLFAGLRQYIYFGSTRGTIAFSTDGGDSWQSLRAPISLPSEAQSPDPWWKRILRAIHLLGPAATPAPQTAPELDGVIQAILDYPEEQRHFLLVGTGQGIFQLGDGDLAWKPFNDGLPGFNEKTGLAGVEVHALAMATSARGHVVAATAQGIYESPLDEPDWKPKALDSANPTMPVLALVACGDVLLAGTSNGVFRSSGHSWAASGRGLPAGAQILSLAAQSPSLVVAGTNTGVYFSTNEGNDWTAINQQQIPVFATSDLFSASLSQGLVPEALVALFVHHGESWRQTPQVATLPGGASWSLTQAGNPVHYLIEKENDQLFIARIEPTVAMPHPAVAVDASGAISVAAPAGDSLYSEWPGFSIENNNIDLDRIVSGIEPGSMVVLDENMKTQLFTPCPVLETAVVSRSAFGRQATITRLVTEANAKLGLFDLREASVYVRSLPLEPYIGSIPHFVPLAGSSIRLAGNHGTLTPGRRLSLSGQPVSVLLRSIGGVFTLTGVSVSVELSCESITALLSTGGFDYAGTLNGSIFRRQSDQPHWDPLESGLPGGEITAIAASDQGILASIIGAGIFRLEGDQWHSLNDGLAIQTPITLAASYKGVLVSDGTQVAFLPPGSQTWKTTPNGPKGASIRQIRFAPNSTVDGAAFAATDYGLFRLEEPGMNWVEVPSNKPKLDLYAIAFTATGQVLGGTDGEVYCRNLDGEWSPLNLNEPRLRVNVLEVSDDGTVWCGTRGGGVLKRTLSGGWATAYHSVSNDVVAMAKSKNSLLVGTSNTSYLTPDEGPLIAVENLRLFTLRESFGSQLDQHIVSEALIAAFAENGIVLGASVTVNVLASKIHWSLRNGDQAYLIRRTLRELEVSHAPLFAARSYVSNGINKLWNLIAEGGAEAVLFESQDEVATGTALSNSPTFVEFSRILSAKVQADQHFTVCVLEEPFEGIYDPATVTICGNIVRMTHGETVPFEILGSGNSAQANQRLSPRRTPLTYLNDPDTSTPVSSLSAFVDLRSSAAVTIPGLSPAIEPTGEPWHQTQELYLETPDAPVYELIHTSRGTAQLIFGDGIHGRRLPTGMENISASYRIGTGRSGNVRAGTLSVFRSRPPGIRTASNPAPAVGGIDPESLTSLRTRVPNSLKSVDRIVSLADYQAFAASFPGISKAQVAWIHAAKRPCIFITAAAEGGLNDSEAEDSFLQLHMAIEERRAGRELLEVRGYNAAFFQVKLDLVATPNSNWDAVAETVRKQAIQSFSFDQRNFGQGVTASQIVAIAQAIEGVQSVTVTQLYRTGFASALIPVLSAGVAHWDPALETIIPAELFTLSPLSIDIAKPIGRHPHGS